MNNLMVDIETSSTERNAVIISIGYCVFDATHIYRSGCIYPKLEEQQDRKTTLATMQWWMRQDRAAVIDTFEPHNNSVATRSRNYIAEEFAQLFDECEALWANGCDFDYGILSDYLGSACPVPFWKQRDYRTIMRVLEASQKAQDKVGTNVLKHSAQADAIHQTKTLQEVVKATNRRAKGRPIITL